MALRGTTKRSSQDQEKRVANLYGGRQSPSSGAAINDAGDVKTSRELIECKTTGGPGIASVNRVPTFVNELAKVVEEAAEVGREGVLTLRYYSPDHYLANRDGWVEITVRRTRDDVARTEEINELQAQVDYWSDAVGEMTF